MTLHPMNIRLHLLGHGLQIRASGEESLIMNKVKNQHYVPRFYLKNFTNSDDKIFVFDKTSDKVFQTAVENIACENYFYDNDRLKTEFQEEQYLEKFYSSIESEFAPFYTDFITKVESKEWDKITKEDKKAFASFLVLQIDRTKEHREMSRQSYSIMKEQLFEKGFTQQQLIDFGFELENPDPKDLHIESILLGEEMRDTLAEILENHIWILIENNTNQPFFTSDNPIAKIANIKEDHISYDGYASEGIEIIFPLNSKYLLVLCEREYFKNLEKIENSKLIITDIENINYYNSLEIIRSYRQVFSCEDSFKIIPELKKVNPESFKMNRKRIK
jgi:hypothetical protein